MLVECVTCVCVWLGAVWVESGVSVGRVSVFLLQWCRWGVGRGLDQGRERWGGVMSV